MALAPGTRLGPYEIVSPLGAGGMGEVYRATDANLKRSVAIKVLPESVARDGERLARFQREAEVLASLNHPNIAAIYGLEKRDGTTALIMELVEGPTLADRIVQGPIPIDEALPIARQIAEALEAAHERGIIHRDLKPANIKLTPDQTIKVLDFGLAKSSDDVAPRTAPLTDSPTLQATAAGVILGTAAYMSPEQARGLPVDARSDIFSFGCVLFEMLTGRCAFEGHTVSDILAAVLKTEPDLTLLRPDTDPRVRHLLQRCLTKATRQRWQAIGDVRYEIEQALAQPSAPAMSAAAAPPAGHTRLAWTTAAVLFVATISLALLWARSSRTAASSVVRVSVNPQPGTELVGGQISPDGSRVTFVATDAVGGRRLGLWVRSLSDGTARRLESVTDPGPMFWSPDSRSLAYFSSSQRELKRVDLAGGAPQVVASAPLNAGGTWNQHGVILFVPTDRGPLVRVPAVGGTPVPLAHTASLEPFAPDFLPDGNQFVFLSQAGNGGDRSLHVGALDSDRIQKLPSIRSPAIYTPPGYLLFTDQDRLMAQRFDAATLALTGEAVEIAESVVAGSRVSASTTGVVAYLERQRAEVGGQLTWFDRGGKPVGTIGKFDTLSTFRLAPDQSRVALDRMDPNGGKRDIWVIDDLATGIATRLTTDVGEASTPVWSADNRTIVFRSFKDGAQRLHLRDASGGGTEEALRDGSAPQTSVDDWSGDGRYIVKRIRTEQWDIRLVPIGPLADEEPRWYLTTPFNEGQSRVSPNSKWLAYTSDESGQLEIYVQSFPVAGSKRRISSDGGTWPRWRRDGKELFYMANGTVMAVPVTTDERFSAGKPAALFQTVNTPGGGPIGIVEPFDVSLDGQRFLLLASPPVQSSISLILNWQEELKRLVPTR